MSVKIVSARLSLRSHVYKSFYRKSHSSVNSVKRARFGTAFLGGLAGGFAGVGSIVLAGYVYYHYSGAKKAVDNVRPAMALLVQTRENLAKEVPGQALKYLREAAQAYVASVPFAGFVIDRVFDSIGDAVQPHAEEANAIIWRAYEDISKIIQEKGNEYKADGAWRVVSVARRLLKELTVLGLEASQPISARLELERRAADAGARASSIYQTVKAKTPSVVKKIQDKAKGIMRSQSKSGTEVPSSETRDQETSHEINEKS